MNKIPIPNKKKNMQFFDEIEIELVSTTDEYTSLRKGDKGKAFGWNNWIYEPVLLVKWDNGANLGLIKGIDFWKEV